MGFSRQEYWSGLLFPSPEDLPDSGIEPSLPHCRQTLYHLSHQGSPKRILVSSKNSKRTVKLRGKKHILTLILLCFVFPRTREIGSKMEAEFLMFCP